MNTDAKHLTVGKADKKILIVEDNEFNQMVAVDSLQDLFPEVAERVGMHQAAVNGDEVQCSDEERWYAGSTFALMKEGNKRATKVADTREELGEPAKGFFIEERKGGYRRCEGYCEVAPFCPQLAREREQQEKANA